MTEFPGYLPWFAGGDPWFTYDELDALGDALKRRADAARKAKANGAKSGRFQRGRRR